MSNFLKIKKNINSVVNYEAGISKLADRKKIIKLSSNESAFGVSLKIKKILKEFENKIFRYPDPENNKLKEIIFKKHKLNKNNIICGNGSDEILVTIAKIFSGPGDEILFSEYGFLMYPIASQLAGAKGIKVKDINYRNSLKNFSKAITKKTKINFSLQKGQIQSVSPYSWKTTPTGTYLRTSYEVANLLNGSSGNSILFMPGYYSPTIIDRSIIGLNVTHMFSEKKYLEFSIEGDDYYPWQQNLFLDDPFSVKEGSVTITDMPGWGVIINPEWLENSEYAVSEMQ